MQRRLYILIIFLAVLPIVGCLKHEINGITFTKFDEGALWHDIYLTNNSGKDLQEVKLTFTLIGEKGQPQSEKRYYILWANGENLKISFEVANSPVNVQKISLVGLCTEGEFKKSWTKPEFDSINTITNN